MRYNLNVLKMKTSWHLYRKINFKLLIISLAQLGEQIILKRLGVCFSQPLALSPTFQSWTPWFLSFYKSLNLHSTLGTVASLERGQVNLVSSYLQLWIGSVHQSYTAGASLGEELIQVSSLGAGGFMLRDLIAFKICHMPSCGWVITTRIVYQLKLLQFSKFDDHSPTMARVIAIYQKKIIT